MNTVLRGAEIKDWSDDNGNKIVGVPKRLGDTRIEFIGRENVIHFAPDVRIQGRISLRGSRSKVEIGERSMFRGRMNLGSDCAVSMGTNIYCGPDAYVTTAEGRQVTLGDDLLISERCSFRADDSHPLYDGPTGERINTSADVYVGDHVWVGWEAMLMPGAWVGKGSVVGARSLVTGSRPVPGRSLVVGTPARVLRTEITWVRKNLQTSDDIDDALPPESSILSAEDSRLT